MVNRFFSRHAKTCWAAQLDPVLSGSSICTLSDHKDMEPGHEMDWMRKASILEDQIGRSAAGPTTATMERAEFGFAGPSIQTTSKEQSQRSDHRARERTG